MKKIFIAIFVIIGLNASAQETWDIKKCIDHAYENNIQLKQKKLDVNYAKNMTLQNKLNLIPSLNAGASHSFKFGRSVSYADNSVVTSNYQTGGVSLESRVTLFNGFKKINTLKKGELDLQSKEQVLEKNKSDIAINVANIYLQVLFNIEMLKISKEQLAISKEQLRKTNLLVKAGKLAEVELLKQKSLVSQDELSLVESQNNLDISYINLFQVMDVKEENAFNVEIPSNLVVDANHSLQTSSSLYNKALELRPEIAKADIEIKKSEKDVSITRAQLIPTLSASASVSSGYADNILNPSTKEKIGIMTQLDDNISKSVGLSLNIPIFNGFQANTSLRNSKLQLENAKLEKENTKNLLRKEIQQMYASAKASMKKYYSAKVASEYSKESFDYSQKKYNAGLIDLVSYKEMKKEYVNSMSKLMQSKYDYVFKTKILDYYVGLPINL